MRGSVPPNRPARLVAVLADNTAPIYPHRRTKTFPHAVARMGQHIPQTPGHVVAVCWLKRSVPDTAVLPRLRVIVRRHLQNTPAQMIITAHLLAAELLRVHLHADQCRVRVALFHIDISVYDDQSVLFCSWSVVLSGVICASGY